MSKISIIIPIYNTQKYLQRCIDSILVQSFTDFELILVNDGSTDDSESICRNYCLKDSRIKLFNKSNGGVSSARNLGIQHASSEYVTFIDSDDFIGKDYILDLIRCHNQYNSDLTIAGFTKIQQHNINCPSKIVNKSDLSILFSNNTICVPYGKIYNRATLISQNIKFQEGIHLGEDTIFVLEYLLTCNTIAICNNSDYFYTDNENSLSKKLNSFTDEFFAFNRFYQICNSLITQNNLDKFATKTIFDWLINSFERVISSINLLPNKHTRIESLKKLDWTFYSKYKRYNTLIERIIKSLLKYRLFNVYDIIVQYKLTR